MQDLHVSLIQALMTFVLANANRKKISLQQSYNTLPDVKIASITRMMTSQAYTTGSKMPQTVVEGSMTAFHA